jgi:Tfp pilus assembly protein PilV
MFKRMQRGASLVEWIVVVVLVVAILGAAAFGIANVAAGRATDVENWIGNEVPALPPLS